MLTIHPGLQITLIPKDVPESFALAAGDAEDLGQHLKPKAPTEHQWTETRSQEVVWGWNAADPEVDQDGAGGEQSGQFQYHSCERWCR